MAYAYFIIISACSLIHSMDGGQGAPSAIAKSSTGRQAKVIGKKAVIGSAVSQQERDAVAQAHKRSEQDISDADLDATSTDTGEFIEAPDSFIENIKKSALKRSEGGLGLPFSFPYLGRPYLVGAGVSTSPDREKGIALKLQFRKEGKTTLKVNPVILSETTLELIGDRLKNRQLHKGDTITVFGEEAVCRLKKIEFDIQGTVISKVVFELTFVKPLKKKIPFINEDIVIKRGSLTLSSQDDYPITLTARTEFRGQKIRALLLFSPLEKLTAALRVKKMPLKTLIPPVATTPLAHMNITQGTVYVDLWVPRSQSSEGDIHVPEDDPARTVRIEATLEKIAELPIDDALEDVDPALIQGELAADLTDELAHDLATHTQVSRAFPDDSETVPDLDAASAVTSQDRAKALIADNPGPTKAAVKQAPQAAVHHDLTEVDLAQGSETLEGLDHPDLMHADDVTIDPDLLEEAMPDLDTTEPATSLEEEVKAEAQEGESCDVHDPCCRERSDKGEVELDTNFTLEANINRYNASVSVGGNDFIIPHVGPIGSATIQLILERTAELREDIELRTDLKKKTLKRAGSSLSIDVSCVPIRNIGIIETGSITISLNRSEKEKGDAVFTVSRGKVDLTGRMRLGFGSLGRLPLEVTATITRKGLIFTGMLDFCEKYGESVVEVSETGYETTTEKQCLKNTLSYGGLTLENVKVVYGYPRYTAPEQEVRETQKAMRQEIKSLAAVRRSAIREVRAARSKGEKPAEDMLKAATQKVPSLGVVKKSESRKQLSLLATVRLWGLRLIATVMLQPDPKNSRKRTLSFSARGVFKDFQPFKYIPGVKNVPGLRDVMFGDVSAELTINTVRGRTRPSIKLSGSALLFGMLLRSNLKFVVNKKGIPGVFIYTTPQRQQALTDIIPVLQGDFFRGITCCNSSFALSSVSEIDTAFFSAEEEAELSGYSLDTIRKGVAFNANVPFAGTLEPVGKWLGINKEPTAAEKLAATQAAQEAATARARGEKVPPQDFCGSSQSMFRMMANINVTNPSLSEFRIGITRGELRQISSTSVQALTKEPKTGEKQVSIYSSERTRFSDKNLQPFAPSTPASTKAFKENLIQEKEEATRKAAEVVAPEDKRAEPMVELDQVEVFFLGDITRPSLGVAAGVLVRPTPEELLRLKGSVEFSPKDVTIGAQMLGTWHNAFTLQGWDLSNVSVMLGFLYGTPFPVRLGGSAFLHVRKDFDVGFKFVADADVSNMGFEGNISRALTLLDIIDIFLKATKFPLPEGVKKLPLPLEIRNVYARYAPKDLRVGDQIIEQGFALKADVTILEKKGHIDMKIDNSGLKAFGTLERVNFLNILKITSADGKGDPKVDIEATLDRQNCLITGLINIADIIVQSSFIEIASDGFKFEFISAVGPTMWHNQPLMLSTVKGKTSGTLQDPQFVVACEFQQHFQQFIKEQVEEKFTVAERAIEQQLGAAQKNIDAINGVVADADRQISDAKQRVSDAKMALKSIQDARAAAVQKINDAKKQVDSIQREIEELDRWYNSLPVA